MKITFGDSDNPNLTLAQWRHGLVVYNNKDLVGRFLELYGEWSEPEIQLLRGIVRPGDTVLDVGAHIGADTIPIAKRVGSKGCVVSFEPQPSLFNLLCANVVLNNLGNTRPLNLAVGDQSCRLRLPPVDYGHSGNFGAVSLAAAERVLSPRDGLQALAGSEVECVALDEYLGALRSCRLLKIDVEGMEEQVLRGARGLIARLRPVIYCEVNREETGDRLLRTMLDLGYAPYWHVFQGYNPDNYYRNPHNEFGTLGDANVLCVPKESDDLPAGLHRAVRFEDVYVLFPGVLGRSAPRNARRPVRERIGKAMRLVRRCR